VLLGGVWTKATKSVLLLLSVTQTTCCPALIDGNEQVDRVFASVFMILLGR